MHSASVGSPGLWTSWAHLGLDGRAKLTYRVRIGAGVGSSILIDLTRDPVNDFLGRSVYRWATWIMPWSIATFTCFPDMAIFILAAYHIESRVDSWVVMLARLTGPSNQIFGTRARMYEHEM